MEDDNNHYVLEVGDVNNMSNDVCDNRTYTPSNGINNDTDIAVQTSESLNIVDGLLNTDNVETGIHAVELNVLVPDNNSPELHGHLTHGSTDQDEEKDETQQDSQKTLDASKQENNEDNTNMEAVDKGPETSRLSTQHVDDHEDKVFPCPSTTNLDLDETLISGKEQLTAKSRPIKDDMDRNIFTAKTGETIRGKGGQLKDEEITVGVYVRKCGFTTSRPLQWAVALETLINEEVAMDCRWDYISEDGKYSECVVKIFYSTTKRVTVHIKIACGLIFISGTNYQEWIEMSFDSWKAVVTNNIYEPINYISKEEPKIVLDDNVNVELDKLWEEHVTLKNALTTLEKSVSDLTDFN